MQDLHKWILNVSNTLFSVGYLKPRILWLMNSENSLSGILFLFSIRELASPPTRYLRSGVTCNCFKYYFGYFFWWSTILKHCFYSLLCNNVLYGEDGSNALLAFSILSGKLVFIIRRSTNMTLMPNRSTSCCNAADRADSDLNLLFLK
jgi:hypothetical protein